MMWRDSVKAAREQAERDQLEAQRAAPKVNTARPQRFVFPTAATPRWTNSLGMVFVPVPGTKVLFGIWDVRVEDYRAFASANSWVDGSWRNPGFAQGEDHPVVNVTWEEANAFCAWLTRQERTAGNISASQSYWLPADAEWSVAVGLYEPGDGTPKDKDKKIPGVYPWGTAWPPPYGAGNYRKSLKVDDFDYTSPVGSFPANRYGLYDLSGNVCQWCEDEYSPGSGTRVLRGASCLSSNHHYMLSSYRFYDAPDYRDYLIGFRVVLADAASR